METKVVSLEVNSNLEQTTKSVGSLKQQLREAQAEVSALADKFGATSQEAINAAKRAGELKDKIGDAKALTDAFNPDAKFKALTASLSGVAGGFGAYQGAMSLAGADSKELEKQLLKVQSAMAISQGLQSVGEARDSFKQLGAVIGQTALGQKALAVATAAQTFVMEASTGAVKLFRLALISTGIGAIAVGLGLLVANFDKVKNAVMNLIPGLASVGKFFGSLIDTVTDFIGVTSESERALDSLKKGANKTLETNKKFLAEHGDQLDKYTKQKIDAKNAYANAIKEDGANIKALQERLNRELAQADTDRQAEKDKKNKEEQDKSTAHNEKLRKNAIDKAKIINAELAKINKEAFDFDVSALEKKMDAELVAIDIVAQAKKANADSLLTEQQLAIQNENALFQSKLFILQQQNLSTEELEIQHQNNLNNINISAQDKIYAKNKEIHDADVKLAEVKSAAQIALMQKTSQVLSQGADLLGKNTAEGKALAIAAATINTYQGITAELATKTVTPFEIGLKIANVAVIAATGFKAVKDIVSVKVPGSGGGGSAPSASTVSAPTFNVVGTSGQNQIAQTLGREQPPIRTYVVANDVTTQQGLTRNIVNTATLGG